MSVSNIFQNKPGSNFNDLYHINADELNDNFAEVTNGDAIDSISQTKITTSETNTNLVLKPDGSGGTQWGSVSAETTGFNEIQVIYNVTTTLISSKEIVLDYTPLSGSLKVFYQGLLWYEGEFNAYTLSGAIITINADTDMVAGDKILTTYKYNS